MSESPILNCSYSFFERIRPSSGKETITWGNVNSLGLTFVLNENGGYFESVTHLLTVKNYYTNITLAPEKIFVKAYHFS